MKIGNSENRSLRIEFDWKNHKFGTILEVLRIGFVVASLFFFVLAAFGCKDKAEAATPNDYDELVVVVQELQEMVGTLIDAGNVQMNCLGNLADIDSSILKRIEKLEELNEPENK